MVLLGITLRIALILYFRYYDFSWNQAIIEFEPFAPAATRHMPFGFGYETGAIAYSLATGHGFSSPFGGSTGPTAWVAPLYPAMCAAVFKLLGCFTLASGFVILSINSIFSALNCIPIVKIGEMTVGRKVGLWSGWIWACGVCFMRWPTTWVWETAISAFLISVLFLQTLRLSKQSGSKKWAWFGLLWGVTALTNPTLLSFLPASGIYVANGQRRNREPWFRGVVISATVFLLCISPWMIRNRAVFGKWIFIRGNAPFEFSLGNYHGSNGLGWFGKHPSQNAIQWDEYARMGEVDYVAEKRREGLAFVREYPSEFLALCGVRLKTFWVGNPILGNPRDFPLYIPLSALMLLGLIAAFLYRAEGRWLYFWLLFLYPLTYYAVFAQPRYRHPIEPEMLMLSTYFVYLTIQDVAARFRLGAKPKPSTVEADVREVLAR
jgi:4-amino-4-deoxy-L-arabinose transferase-like glycosyltransferase